MKKVHRVGWDEARVLGIVRNIKKSDETTQFETTHIWIPLISNEGRNL
jgi:translation elongation factor EF-1alpha